MAFPPGFLCLYCLWVFRQTETHLDDDVFDVLAFDDDDDAAAAPDTEPGALELPGPLLSWQSSPL